MQSLAIRTEHEPVSSDAIPALQAQWSQAVPGSSGEWKADLELIIAEIKSRREVEAGWANDTLHRLELSSFRDWGINE